MFSPETSAPLARQPVEATDGNTSYLIPKPPSKPMPKAPGEVVSSLFVEEAAIATAREKLIRHVLAERAFDLSNPPPKPPAILSLDGKTISTPGNLTLVQGPVKSGKSAVMAAIMAAVLNGKRQGQDTLGFSSENPRGFAFIHFDTEQSRYDSDALVRRAMARAKAASLPAWFRSYTLTDLGIEDRKAAIAMAVEDSAKEDGGIHSVVIDGVGDLCTDPNDPAEAFALVGELHSAAIAYDCPFILVIHENPGTESGKTRGHLGSHLARKAETPIRLSKDEASGITTVWADRARHCHIPRGDGVCFQWSDAAGMHASCGSAREIRAEAKRSKFADEADRAFGDQERLSYTDLVARICEAAGVAEKTAQARVKTYAAEGLIVKRDDGKYTPGDGQPLTLKLPSKDPSRV